MLEMVVGKLGDVREQLVFLGGAVAGLLASNPAAEPIRETDDVDCIVEVGASRLEYHAIESRLFKLGWQPGSARVPTDPMCRFRHGALIVDVMPDHPEVLGFASVWGRAEILEEAERAPADLRSYLGEQLHSMWPRLMSETLPGALRSDLAKLRLVERRLDAIRQLKP